MGQVPSSDRLSHDSMLIESIRSWQTELEAGSLPPKQAPMYTVSIILACELSVRKSSLPVGYRAMAFILIMIWGTLRADDVQNIDPASLRLSGVGLRFTLGRASFLGPTKSVFVSLEGGVGGIVDISVRLNLLWHVNEVFSSF